MNNVAAVFILLLFSYVAAQHDASVCTPVKDSGKPMPTLGKGYSVRTELNIVTENMTVEVHEYFDSSVNMSAYEQVEPDGAIYAILNYNTNQFIYIEPAEEGMAKRCQVTQLDKYVPRLDQQTKESNIIRLYDVLTYGKGSQMEYSTGILRGEKVQIWKACVYDKAWQATFNVTWYFSAMGWRTSSGTQPVPIRMHLIGKTNTKGTVHNHERIYDFSEYNPTAPSYKAFELHPGTYCQGLKQKKKLPDTPVAFSFGLESVSMGSGENIRNDLYLYYDTEKKLLRMDYVEADEGVPGYGQGPLTQIHDYNSGVGYLLYKNKGSCADPFPIEQGSEDSVAIDSTHVRMKTSKEFFGLNKKNFIYEGERNVRGINCDVWIDSRTDWPQNNSAQSLWEWSFSTDEVLANAGSDSEYSFPVSLGITQSANGTALLYNIYSVENNLQEYNKFDISMCFDDLHRLDYQFSIHGSFKSIVQNNEDKLISNVRMTLSIYAGISPLRVANIRLDYASDDVIVYFTLIGLPQVKGDTKQSVVGNNLQDATTRIVNGITTRGLSIDVGDGKEIPLKDSSYHKVINMAVPAKGKYKPGDMAGVGIGMLLVGLVAGVILTTYLIRKKMNDQFKAVKFDAQMEAEN